MIAYAQNNLQKEISQDQPPPPPKETIYLLLSPLLLLPSRSLSLSLS